jgi:hypothetical protein
MSIEIALWVGLVALAVLVGALVSLMMQQEETGSGIGGPAGPYERRVAVVA